jgi:Tfp pilus assembly protein PilX
MNERLHQTRRAVRGQGLVEYVLVLVLVALIRVATGGLWMEG